MSSSLVNIRLSTTDIKDSQSQVVAQIRYPLSTCALSQKFHPESAEITAEIDDENDNKHQIASCFTTSIVDNTITTLLQDRLVLYSFTVYASAFLS